MTPSLKEFDRYVHWLANRYARKSWGLVALDREDYVQEAYRVALEMFQFYHKRRLTNLQMVIRKGMLYHVHHLWKREVRKVLVTVDLSAAADAIGAQGMEELYARNFWLTLLEQLTPFQCRLLRALTERDPNDLTTLFWQDCLALQSHAPIRRAEEHFLALYLGKPHRQIRAELSAIKATWRTLTLEPV